MAKTNLTAERLRELLHYDALTGLFTRKISPSNNVVAGAVVGGNSNGYLRASIDDQSYRLHRLAWLYCHGYFPTKDIDHINGNRKDNRIANLREATRSENLSNKGKSPSNKSGFKGVWWHVRANKWAAAISLNNKSRHLGLFPTAEEAHKAYIAAAIELRGEFARGS